MIFFPFFNLYVCDSVVNSCRDLIHEKVMALSYKEDVSGFIFMCNHETKLDCYRYRVFGLPEWRLKDVEKIRPGTSLFLFDCDTRLLYGTYTATSSGNLGIEESAFGGKFPAQVKLLTVAFKITHTATHVYTCPFIYKR